MGISMDNLGGNKEMTEQELKGKIEHILYECNTLRISYQTARDQILALIKEAGYVQLAEDLPPSFEVANPTNVTGTGWRKVEL